MLATGGVGHTCSYKKNSSNYLHARWALGTIFYMWTIISVISVSEIQMVCQSFHASCPYIVETVQLHQKKILDEKNVQFEFTKNLFIIIEPVQISR